MGVLDKRLLSSARVHRIFGRRFEIVDNGLVRVIVGWTVVRIRCGKNGNTPRGSLVLISVGG
eukprot:2580386-Pyramimonas_sp.AAC.1